MPRTIRMVIAYDGTDFHGWQRQANARAVQEVVQDVVRRVAGEPVNVVGASRTDTGVHALGQVAHVVTDTRVPTDNLRRAVNHRLPDDIAIVHAEDAPDGFHAIGWARNKLYRYRVFNAERRPLERGVARFAWHFPFALDLDRLRDAAARLVGRHDFAGFASQGSPRSTTVRTVSRLHVRRRLDEVQFDVEGDGFLYNQVRNMVGTLIEIGRGHWPAEQIDAILASADRRDAGPTAPALGLCLRWIRYPRLWPLEAVREPPPKHAVAAVEQEQAVEDEELCE